MVFSSETARKHFLNSIWFFVPPFIWMVLILILIGLPGYSIPSSQFFANLRLDLLVHAGIFGFWVLLMLFAMTKQQSSKWLFYHKYFVSLFAGFSFSALTELLQSIIFVQRSADVFDFFANTIGCMLGALYFRLIFKK